MGHSKKNNDPESDGVADPEAGPETQKLKRKEFEEKLAGLHVELVQLQDWFRCKKKKICIVFVTLPPTFIQLRLESGSC
jgi:polyphosphate kinase 2 (PPK2 family)